jgi:hypothetical protein
MNGMSKKVVVENTGKTAWALNAFVERKGLISHLILTFE